MFILPHILSVDSLQDVVDTIKQLTFEDGRVTAGWSARLVKNNEQLSASVTLDLLRERIQKTLQDNDLFSLFARPKAFAPLLFRTYVKLNFFDTFLGNGMDGFLSCSFM
jgi:PKHD-type hydroxylase